MSDIALSVTSLDRELFTAINSGLHCSLLDRIMPAITDLGLSHVQAVCIVLIAIFRGAARREIHARNLVRDLWRSVVRARHWVGPIIVSIAVSGVVTQSIKRTHRDRPTEYYAREHQLGRSMDVQVHTIAGVRAIRFNGFPSGHTATSVGIATVVTLLALRRRSRWAVAAFAWSCATLIGFSRVYVADHWPGDVAGGVVVGMLSGVCALWIAGRLAKRSNAKRACAAERAVTTS